MKKPIIHIGANKTASTTLQRSLFSHHTGLHYMGEDAIGYESYSDIVNAMVSDDDLYFPKNLCRDLFHQHLTQASDKTFLYSNEDVMTSRIPVVCAKRLKSLLPDAKILLVIRNQNTAIPSFYANHGAFLKPAPPSYYRRHVKFDDWISSQVMFMKYGALAGFLYNKLVSVYADLFGVENIHILLFEEFIDNKKIFVEKLCQVLNIDVDEAVNLLEDRHDRQRITSRMLAYNQFRTSFFWNVPFFNYIPGGRMIADVFQHFIESGPSAKIEVSSVWREKIFDLYAEDNKALALAYELPLKKYGYPIA